MMEQNSTAVKNHWQQCVEAIMQRRRIAQRQAFPSQNTPLVAEKYAAIAERVCDSMQQMDGAELPTAEPSGSATLTRRAGEVVPQDGKRADNAVDAPNSVKRGSHTILEGRTRQFLAQVLDSDIPVVKLYTNRAADSAVREQKADAVTYRDGIAFRAGQYAPQTAKGIALLGHELTHVVQNRLMEQSGQEQQALNQERVVLDAVAGRSPNTPSPMSIRPQIADDNRSIQDSVPQQHDAGRQQSVLGEQSADSHQYITLHNPQTLRTAHSTQTKAAPAMQSPQAALSDRRLPKPAEKERVMQVGQLSAKQLTYIKDAVYQDLMERVRSEFERGG